MSKNELFVTDFKKFGIRSIFAESGNASLHKSFVTAAVKIKKSGAENLNIIHLVLKGKFFKIYLRILEFLKAKKTNSFFQY